MSEMDDFNLPSSSGGEVPLESLRLQAKLIGSAQSPSGLAETLARIQSQTALFEKVSLPYGLTETLARIQSQSALFEKASLPHGLTETLARIQSQSALLEKASMPRGLEKTLASIQSQTKLFEDALKPRGLDMIFASIQSHAKLFEAASKIRGLDTLFSGLAPLNNTALTKALSSADSETLQSLYEQSIQRVQAEHVVDALIISDFYEGEITQPEAEAEAAVIEFLNTGEGREGLTRQQLALLFGGIDTALKWLVYLVFVLNFFGVEVSSETARNGLSLIQSELFDARSAAQVSKLVRKEINDVPLEILINYRFIRGEGVRMRGAPGMKSQILPVHLQDGTLLEVLDNGNRDWLFVRLVSDIAVQGWVSRKYVRRLIR